MLLLLLVMRMREMFVVLLLLLLLLPRLVLRLVGVDSGKRRRRCSEGGREGAREGIDVDIVQGLRTENESLVLREGGSERGGEEGTEKGWSTGANIDI